MKPFPKDAKNTPEFTIFAKLTTPAKVQDFLDTFPINFEKGGETNFSPLVAIRRKRMHCFEGAQLAAAIFWYNGQPPYLLELEATQDDISHAVAPFRKHGRWGAVSKSNHASLRYREPVYATVRELVMSYFHEYFKNSSGKKTLRSYTHPFDASRCGTGWLTSTKGTWNIVRALDSAKHYEVLPEGLTKLRPADHIERRAGKIVEW